MLFDTKLYIIFWNIAFHSHLPATSSTSKLTVMSSRTVTLHSFHLSLDDNLSASSLPLSYPPLFAGAWTCIKLIFLISILHSLYTSWDHSIKLFKRTIISLFPAAILLFFLSSCYVTFIPDHIHFGQPVLQAFFFKLVGNRTSSMKWIKKIHLLLPQWADDICKILSFIVMSFSFKVEAACNSSS